MLHRLSDIEGSGKMEPPRCSTFATTSRIKVVLPCPRWEPLDSDPPSLTTGSILAAIYDRA